MDTLTLFLPKILAFCSCHSYISAAVSRRNRIREQRGYLEIIKYVSYRQRPVFPYIFISRDFSANDLLAMSF